MKGVLAAAVAALLVARAGAPPTQPGGPVDLVVMSTTDIHGRLRGWDYYADSAEPARGLSRVATVFDSVRSSNQHVIAVDAGDFLQGNPLTYAAARIDSLAPNPVIAAMNVLGYDAVTVGNHEFNYGLVTLARATQQANFPLLAANAFSADGRLLWRGSVIVERAHIKIGIVGLTNPGSMAWDRDHLAGKVRIDDIVTSAHRAVEAVRSEGAEVVVVVAHAGLSGASSYDTTGGLGSENPMARVAREVPGIDLIVFGHTHQEVRDTTINGVLLTQPRNWATSVSVARLTVQRTGARVVVTRKGASIVRAAGHDEKASVVAAAQRGHDAARKYANTVLGSTQTSWRSDSARVADTPILDFVAEVMRRTTGAMLASTAAFTLQARIPAGPVTVAQIAQLYPYDNTIRVVRISGAQLREYLEHDARYYRVTGSGDAARAAPDPAVFGFNFETVVGVDYVIDISRPVGERITTLTRNGTPVAATDTFTIALSNYRAAGGGGYAMVAKAPVVRDDQAEIRQLLIDEITRRKTLRREDYFTQNWKVVPSSLAKSAYEAMNRTGDFESVRRPESGVQSASGRSPNSGPRTAVSIIRIISTNDFHGALEARLDGNNGLRGGAAHVAALVRRAQKECGSGCASLLVDGGDLFQGTPASNLAYGRPVVAYYNAMGYAAVALGNHEFDWGQDTLRARIREMKFGMLSANTRLAATGRTPAWLRQDTIVERGGVKIGIIGLTTVSTPRVTKAINVADLRFLDDAPVVDERAKALRARGAELVIVIGHVGGNCGANGCGGELIQLAQQASEPIDAFIGGHTHTQLNTEVRGVPVMHGRSSGRAITVTDLPVDRAARAGMRHEVWEVKTDSITPDPQIDSIVRAATASVMAVANRPVVTVAEDLKRTGRQYALGNLIADSQRDATRADVALMNNGGIRTELRAGPATYGALFEIQPFGNMLVKVTVTGKTLRAYFERLAGRPFIGVHASGVVMRYDTTRAAGSRITDLRVGGGPVDDAREYTITMSDFMLTGGDGLGLSDMAVKEDWTGIIDLDAFIDYVKKMPGGVRADGTPRLIASP